MDVPELSPAERSHLQAILFSQGYQVILKLMAAQCEIVETALLQAPNHDAARVISAHNTAKATRDFYEKFQTLMQLAAQVPDEQVNTKPLSPLEVIQRQF